MMSLGRVLLVFIPLKALAEQVEDVAPQAM
jgi:hypothetical protein